MLQTNAMWAQQQPDTATVSVQQSSASVAHATDLHPAQWASIAGSFKKFRNFLGVAAQPITNYSWTVPAGVTKIMIECWGGGAAALIEEGGAGGSYYMVVVPVASGTTLQIAVGDGGRGDASFNARDGNNTTVSWVQSSSNYFVIASGGTTGDFPGNDQLPGGGYRFFVLGGRGQAGDLFFNRKSQVTNTVQVYGGTGGGSFGFPFNGGAGHNYSFIEIINTLDVYSSAAPGAVPGGGAGGGMGNFSAQTGQYSHGGAGMVIIRW